MIDSLADAARDMEIFLIDPTNREEILPWLDAWFAIYRMLQISEVFNETYRTIIDPAKERVTLYCLDPAKPLAKTLKGLRSAIFFSGTLTPLDYFKDVLGGKADDPSAIYASPFSADQMKIKVIPLDLSFQQRGQTLDGVAQAIQAHLQSTPGNHLIFCPSMAYLDQFTTRLSSLGVACHAQKTSMNEVERGAFLTHFRKSKSIVALAVMGGIFAEGIDLPGSLLVGVTVIGVGLPGLSIERDLLAQYFDAREKAGFDYAYRFPGMQRVLQAIGRLIRSEEDQGSALLIDRRFLEERYQDLFPNWWRVDFEDGQEGVDSFL